MFVPCDIPSCGDRSEASEDTGFLSLKEHRRRKRALKESEARKAAASSKKAADACSGSGAGEACCGSGGVATTSGSPCCNTAAPVSTDDVDVEETEEDRINAAMLVVEGDDDSEVEGGEPAASGGCGDGEGLVDLEDLAGTVRPLFVSGCAYSFVNVVPIPCMVRRRRKWLILRH